MKKRTKAMAALMALAMTMTAGLTGCGSTNTNTNADTGSASDSGEKTELVVFAAASMTETLNQIKTDYEAQHKDITLTYNFDSSGTLKTQIQEGATCDVFISAAQKQMDQLDASKDETANPKSWILSIATAASIFWKTRLLWSFRTTIRKTFRALTISRASWRAAMC